MKKLVSKLKSTKEEVDQKGFNSESSDKEKSPVVSFGSFQVIEMATEDSDEHFAVIKNEINKLSQMKPKKIDLERHYGIFIQQL